MEISKSSSSKSSAIISKMSQRFSVLCTPLFGQSSSTIDMIYSRTMPLIRRAELLLENEDARDQLCQLKLEAEQLKDGLNLWPGTVPQEWIPRSVGVISSNDKETM
jgi:hypothetical protein